MFQDTAIYDRYWIFFCMIFTTIITIQRLQGKPSELGSPGLWTAISCRGTHCRLKEYSQEDRQRCFHLDAQKAAFEVHLDATLQ